MEVLMVEFPKIPYFLTLDLINETPDEFCFLSHVLLVGIETPQSPSKDLAGTSVDFI